MTDPASHTVAIITGPTASGKSDVAIQLARHFGTEIVSADSRQIYREMQMGTARLLPDEWQGIPHHLLGHVSIHDEYDVSRFEREALSCLEKILRKQSTAIVCGGTGLYVRALCQGLDNIPDVPADLRQALRERYAGEGPGFLQEYLALHDPDTHRSIDLQNPHRLLRAVEVHMATGKPFSAYRTGKKVSRPFRMVKIGLKLPTHVLEERIRLRVEAMLAGGLLDEVRQLLPFRHLQALQTVGYQELFDHLEGKCSLEDAAENIKVNTRRYAKRQLTWLRKEPDMHWFAPEDLPGMITLISKEHQTP